MSKRKRRFTLRTFPGEEAQASTERRRVGKSRAIRRETASPIPIFVLQSLNPAPP
jgi:hypothetical protein